MHRRCAIGLAVRIALSEALDEGLDRTRLDPQRHEPCPFGPPTVDDVAGQPALRGAFADLPIGARVFFALAMVGGRRRAGAADAGDRLRALAGLPRLLAGAAIAALFRVDLPFSTHGATMSLSFAFAFAALLLLGPAPDAAHRAAGGVGAVHGRRLATNPLHRTAFSMAALAVTAKAAGLVFLGLGGDVAFAAPGLVGQEKAILGAALTYFVLNTLLTAIAVSLTSGQPLAKIWNEHAVWSALSYIVGAGVAATAAVLLSGDGAWLAPLLVGPLYLTHRTYRVYSDRIEDERRRAGEMSDVHLATIEALALAIDAKDQTATSRIRRVQVHAAGMARAVGMSPADVQGVRTAALLHDIGKLAVPEHILSKPGPLTTEEFQRMKVHPQVGAEIIATVPFPYPVAPVIHGHHERWDGKGYPDGLKGDEIPLGARILAVVDHFDALTSERPSHQRALDRRRAGGAAGRSRPGVRPARGGPVRRAPADARRRGAAQVGAAAAAVVRDAQRLARSRRAGHGSAAQARVPGHRAGASRDLRALRDRAVDGHQPRRRRHDGAHLVEVEQPGAVHHLRALPARGNRRPAALPVRHRHRRRAAAAAGGEERAGPGRLGGPQSSAARQRAAERRPRGRRRQPGETTLQSALVCPLVFNDRLIGALAVYDTEPGRFTDDHRRLLDRVAEQAAGVVNNSIVFEQTKRDSLTDPLTGLPNTRFMFVHLTRELARAERLKTEVSLLVMDLDGFKEINDMHGHHAGDKALREVARVLRSGIRPYDICVRYAGDEFVVVLSGCGAEEAQQKQRELQQAIADIPFEVRPGRFVQLGSSFGNAVFPRDGEAYETLLATADKRMYQDKAQRKAQRARPARRARRGRRRQAAVGVC